jgi:endonuclease/exonuclease/phosphatase family metal-dependent hydrolase
MHKLLLAIVASVALALVGGSVAAAGTPAAGTDDGHVRVVNLNLLHGVFCPNATDGCQAPDRVELLMRQLEEADCPEVVGLQEINQNLSDLLEQAVPKACDGDYEIVFGTKVTSLDTERVLTTLPVVSTKVVKLAGNFRTASRVTLKSPLGPLVVVTTHQDGDPENPSGMVCKNCPPPCKEAGVDLFGCQTVIAAKLADDAGGAKAVRVLMGDFNVTPASGRYQLLTAADGWTDSHVAAGNAECDAATSVGCTAGRDDKTLESLQDPTVRQVERIDFIFVKAPTSCGLTFDPRADDDGDGIGTGLWNDAPTLDGPNGIVWTSDHTGTSADFACAR